MTTLPRWRRNLCTKRHPWGSQGMCRRKASCLINSCSRRAHLERALTVQWGTFSHSKPLHLYLKSVSSTKAGSRQLRLLWEMADLARIIRFRSQRMIKRKIQLRINYQSMMITLRCLLVVKIWQSIRDVALKKVHPMAKDTHRKTCWASIIKSQSWV